MMKILCCGDSHTRVFNHCNDLQTKILFDVCVVKGATAQGSVNPNSKTNALHIFKGKIHNTTADKILIMLGEVDCGFVIWVRSKRNNISIDEQINTSVKNLFTFLDNIIKTTKYTNNDIIVCGSILPTIKDSTDKKFLDGARSEVNVSQLERTNKTLEYNNLLEKTCNQYGYNYIEITKEIIGANGIVKNTYLSKNLNDHHLDNESTCNLWLSKIKNIL